MPSVGQADSSPRIWLALGTVYLVWGSTYLAIRVMVETMPPALGSGVRFALAGAIMLVALAGRRSIRATRIQLLWTAVIGTLLAAGGNGLVTVAETDVPSGLAALLVATVPLWVVLYRTVTGDRPQRASLTGIALGFAGVAVLLAPGGRPDHIPLGMSLLVVLAAASWGLGSFVSGKVDLPADVLVATGWQMFFGGLVMAVAGLLAGEAGSVDVGAFSTDSILAFAYLVLIGSIVAFSAYAWLLGNAPISQVTTYAYVNPVIAVILGAVFLEEGVGVATIAGSALIVAAVYVIVRTESASRARVRELSREEPGDRPDEREGAEHGDRLAVHG